AGGSGWRIGSDRSGVRAGGVGSQVTKSSAENAGDLPNQLDLVGARIVGGAQGVASERALGDGHGVAGGWLVPTDDTVDHIGLAPLLTVFQSDDKGAV